MPQIGAHSLRLSVDELLCEFKPMKGGIPELRVASAVNTRLPAPGSGGETTRARTRSGRIFATVCATKLPTSYPAITEGPRLNSSINPATLRACAAPE